MKSKLIFLFTFVFLCAFYIYSQSNYPSERIDYSQLIDGKSYGDNVRYVNAANGLRMRTGPTMDSEVIRVLPYGERVILFRRSIETITIDGVTAYWYQLVMDEDDIENWVFGGYLSRDLPLNTPVVIGSWDDVENLGPYGRKYFFSASGKYQGGWHEAQNDYFGTWRLNGNVLIIEITHRTNNGTRENFNRTENIRVEITDRNNIILNNLHGERIILRRSLYQHVLW